MQDIYFYINIKIIYLFTWILCTALPYLAAYYLVFLKKKSSGWEYILCIELGIFKSCNLYIDGLLGWGRSIALGGLEIDKQNEQKQKKNKN